LEKNDAIKVLEADDEAPFRFAAVNLTSNGRYLYQEWQQQDNLVSSPIPEGGKPMDRRKVFVVHGRNEAANDALFQFLRAIGLNPIEWSQAISLTGKPAPYIGEVLDAAFSNAQAIVVLLTGDDVAKLRDEFVRPNDPSFEKQLTVQARPNVIFEAGMALGRHDDRTVIIELGELRPFTDISGRHLIKLNDSTARRQELAQRLENAGCDVDLTGTQWHKAGTFKEANLPLPNVELDESNSANEPCGFESISVGSAISIGLSNIPTVAGTFLVSVEQNTIRFRLDGNDPTITEGTLLQPGDSISIKNHKAMEKFKAIAISGDARLQIHYFV
jgi:predicted nucleotide-binding protein